MIKTMIENDTSVVGKLRKATNTLILNHPFWAALRFRMRVVIGNGPGFVTPTAATDGRTLWFNTEFCNDLTREEFLGLVVHELGHVVFLHALRRGVRDPAIWNIAADYVINLCITKDGFTLPTGGLLDDQYDGMHTEEVYRRVYKKSGGGETASGVGEQCPWGQVLDAQGDDGKALSPEDKKKLEQSMAVDIHQAMDTAKKQGNLPGHLRESFDKLLTPVMDWRDILSQFIADRFPCDYSWMNSSRRGLALGMRFPGSGEEDTYGQIAIGVDTSGSISREEIQKMMSEVCHCLATYEARGMEIELPVAYCDTQIHHEEVLSPGDTPYENAKGGGGGTCFAPVMEWVSELPDKPEALLYLTDGHCNTFGVDPNIPVLWVLSAPEWNNTSFQPPFGEVMEMVDNEN